MIKYFEGTVFNTDAKAIVNTINCIGVMNAGIALEFGLRYPKMLDEYTQKCKNKEIQVGKIYYFKDTEKTIINFPTKWHFKYPSKIEWIEMGLKNFVETYKQYNIVSVAFPKLGTLNGQLDWKVVKNLMEYYLSKVDIDVYICLDDKKEAEGIEAKMLEFINKLDINRIKSEVKLNEKQIIMLNNYKPFSRFWKIKEIESLGTKTYKALFKYCYNQVNGSIKIVQPNFLDSN